MQTDTPTRPRSIPLSTRQEDLTGELIQHYGLTAIPPAELNLIRLLAASKESGLILQLGIPSLIYTEALLQGVDMMTRLVINLAPEEAPEMARRTFANDLRIAIHQQQSGNFLNDIKKYLFDLIVISGNHLTAAHFAQALAMRHRAGILLVEYNADQVGINPEVGKELLWHRLWPQGNWWLVTARDKIPRQRRGGRNRLQKLDRRLG